MDPGTGKLYDANDPPVGGRRLILVRRKLTAREHMDRQIQLYSPCGCGSGKKFKFCCKVKA